MTELKYVETVTAYVGADGKLYKTQSEARISLLETRLANKYHLAVENDKYCDERPIFTEVMNAFCDHRELFGEMLQLADEILAGKK